MKSLTDIANSISLRGSGIESVRSSNPIYSASTDCDCSDCTSDDCDCYSGDCSDCYCTDCNEGSD